MYDTIVVALVYRIAHRDSVDYSSAQSLDSEEPGFRIRIEDKVLRFEFKDPVCLGTGSSGGDQRLYPGMGIRGWVAARTGRFQVEVSPFRDQIP